MAQINIFSEQVDGFSYNSSMGVFFTAIKPSPFVLELEKTYIVSWDGNEHELVPFIASTGGQDTIAIGDRLLIGEESTGQMFAMAYNPSTDYMNFFAMTQEASHTISVSLLEEDVEPEPEPEEVGVILKDRDGIDQRYYGVKGIKLDATDGSQMYFSAGYPEDGSISLDFSDGDILATPEKGKLWSSMAIPKPEGLVPENVLEGVEIGGVVGTYVTPKTEEKTVEADFSAGDMVVTPSEGKVLSLVNIPKPETLVAENIAEGVNVAGVVGTHSGGGGAVEEDYIQFFDYDGTLVQRYAVSEISGLTELPEAPVHEGLTFQGWNYSLEEIKEATEDTQSILHVGAMYIPTDGKTKLYIKLEFASDLAVKMYYSQTVSGGVSVDWGDGTTGSGTFTGNGSLTHTYASIGEYVISLAVADGCVLGFGNGSNSTMIFGVTGSSSYSDILTRVHIGKNVTSINDYAFNNNENVELITVPRGVLTIGSNAFASLFSLRALVIPNTVTSVGSNGIRNCYCMEMLSIPNSVTTLASVMNLIRLRELVIPKSITSVTASICQYLYAIDTIVNGYASSSYNNNFARRIVFTRQDATLASYGFKKSPIKTFVVPDGMKTIDSYAFDECTELESVFIPESVGTINTSAFSKCYSLAEINLPSGLTQIANYLFQNCYSLKEINIPDAVTSIGANSFDGCQSLQRVVVPSNVTSLGNYAFSNCYALKEIILPEGLLTIGNQAFNNCYSLSKLTIPSTVTTIGSYPFNYNHSLKEVHFLSPTPPTFSGKLKQYGNISKCTFYVPKGSLSAYKSATNMSEYSAQIVEE